MGDINNAIQSALSQTQPQVGLRREIGRGKGLIGAASSMTMASLFWELHYIHIQSFPFYIIDLKIFTHYVFPPIHTFFRLLNGLIMTEDQQCEHPYQRHARHCE